MTDHDKLASSLAPESAHRIAFEAKRVGWRGAGAPAFTVTPMASVSASASSDTAKPNVGVEPSLDISLLKEQARKGLVDALNSVNGGKTLVLDPTLAGPLSLVTEVSLLKV